MRKNHKTEKGSSCTDSEFISMFAKEIDMSPEKAKDIVKKFINCVRECLELNGYINLRRLGRFIIRKRKHSKFKNFEGRLITLSTMYMIKFTSSASFRNMLNRKLASDHAKERRKK